MERHRISSSDIRQLLTSRYDRQVLCRWRDAGASQKDLYRMMDELREALIEELGEDAAEVLILEDYMDVVWGHAPRERTVWDSSLRTGNGGDIIVDEPGAR